MGQFGQELRREREDRGVTVEFICAVTKVSSRHVEALEAGRYGDLPGGVFRKGIVRSYVAAVGLEESPWIERFEASLREFGAPPPDDQDWAEFAENVRKSRSTGGSGTGMRWFGVAVMLAALLVCGWLTWKFVLHGMLSL
jgi:cytoskeleton protein RodZ